MFISSPIDPLTAENVENAPATAPAPKRFRVYLTERLHYTVDVLAQDEEEARELALEDETPRSEAECTFFDAEEIAVIPDDDETFLPSNGCYRCGKRVDDDLAYPHCSACIEKIKAEREASDKASADLAKAEGR
jgi:hypothetical protein